MNCIIAFSGLPQTGKTTLSRLLSRELRCKFASFGDFVRKQAIERGIPHATRRDLQDLGQSLIKGNIRDFCLKVLESARFSPGEQIVIDGVRHREVLNEISNITISQPIKLVHLTASEETRRRRLKNEQDLASIDSHAVELEVESTLRDMADIIIRTEGSVDEALQQLLNWIRNEADCEEAISERRQ